MKNRKSRVITIWSLLLCCLFGAHAQNGNYKGAERYEKFKKTTLLVVLDEGDTGYNRQMKKAIAAYWNVSEFSFITRAELYEYLPNEKYSVLLPTDREVHYEGLRGRKLDQTHSDIALLLCDRDSIHHMPGHFEITSIELQDVHDTASYNYKLPALIQAMQHYIGFLQNAGEMDRDQHAKKTDKFSNMQRKKVGEMTLLVCKDDFMEGSISADRAKKLYGNGIEIVDKARIRAAIATQEEGVAFLHLADRNRDATIIEVNGGRMLYSKPLEERGKLMAEDFERMVKACK